MFTNIFVRMLKNFGFLTISELLCRVSNFFILVLIGRCLGPEKLGEYSTATALAGYFLFLADFGISQRLIRESSADLNKLNYIFNQSISIKIFSTLITFLLLILIYIILPYGIFLKKLFTCFAFASIIQSFTYLNEAVFRAKERMDLEAFGSFIRNFIFFGLSAMVLLKKYSPIWIGYSAISAAIVQFLISFIIFRPMINKIGINFTLFWNTLHNIIPYALTSFANVAFVQLDVIIISLISPQTVVGEYISISRYLLIAGFLPILAGRVILPVATRFYIQNDLSEFRRGASIYLRTSFLISGIVILFFVIFAERLMTIFGPDFKALYPLLQIGSIYIFFKFSNSALEIILTSANCQAMRAKSVILGGFITILLTYVFVPLLGVLGAVLSLILSEFFLTLLFLMYSKDLINIKSIWKSA